MSGGTGSGSGDALGGGTGSGSGDTLSGGGNLEAGNKSNNGEMITRLSDRVSNFLDIGKSILNNGENFVSGLIATTMGFSFKSIDPTIITTANGQQKIIETYRIEGKHGTNKFQKFVNENIEKRYYRYLNSFDNNNVFLKNVNQSKVLRATKIINGDTVKNILNGNFNVSKILKNDLIDNWSFSSSNFWSPENWIKGNGAANIILSTGGTLADYTFGKNKGNMNSSGFYAALSTDITLGVASTALSAGAGLMAAAGTGAAFGSVVPGIGTAIGAGVGILASIYLASSGGKKLKKAVNGFFKRGYDWIGNRFKRKKEA